MESAVQHSERCDHTSINEQSVFPSGSTDQSHSPEDHYINNSGSQFLPHESELCSNSSSNTTARVKLAAEERYVLAGDSARTPYDGLSLPPDSETVCKICKVAEEAFEAQSFPLLPDSLSDCDSQDDSDQVKSLARKPTPNPTCLRCPNCATVLKWVLMEGTKNGLHYMRRSSIRCECDDLPPQPPTYEGPVFVSRGAW